MAKRKRKTPRNKGITRLDSGSTHGWQVKGYKNGKIYSKLFSDLKCEGKRKAQQVARDFRDELYEKLAQIPTKPRGRRINYRNARNTSGVLGVCRTRQKRPSGKIYEYYSVTWRPSPGVQKGTSFSIRKYGEKKAFKLAVAHRRKMLRKIHGPGIFLKIAARQKGS